MGVETMLSRVFLEAHPEDAARVLEEIPVEQAAAGLAALAAEIAAPVLERMEPVRAAGCLRGIPREKAAEILSSLRVDVSVRVLRKLELSDRERLLEGMSDRTMRQVRRILDLPAGTAAQIMDPMVTAFPEDLQAGEALRRARRDSQRVSYYVYVTDPDQKLVGVLTLRQLMLAAPRSPLASLVHGPVARLGLRDTYAGILRHPGWRRFHALPVVDQAGVLAGVVRYEALRRLEEEMTSERSEDLLLLGTTLGETWVKVAAAMLDGLSAVLRGRRIQSWRGTEETGHGR